MPLPAPSLVVRTCPADSDRRCASVIRRIDQPQRKHGRRWREARPKPAAPVSMRVAACGSIGRRASLALFAGFGFAMSACAQQLVVSATHDYLLGGPGPLLVIDDLAQAWYTPDIAPYYLTTAQPHAINPHGLVMLDRDHVAAAHAGRSWVDLIDLPNGVLSGFLSPDGAGSDYTGYGTVTMNPAATHVLLASGSPPPAGANQSRLWVVPTPLTSLSVASHVVSLPGVFGTAQTRAITFDVDTGRAYVAHSNGISAIDPPYTQASLAFTIALPSAPSGFPALGRSIALSPDKATLASAEYVDGRPLTIVRAPFSAASAVETLALDGMVGLDTVAFVPGGSQLLVVDSRPATGAFESRVQMYAVSAPFDASAQVERLVFLDVVEFNGYEDIAVSPDGRFAVLSGGGINPSEDLRVVRAPFTETGFRSRRIRVSSLAPPYVMAGRGAGMAAFWTTPSTLLPQLSIDRTSVTEGDAGARALTFTVRLGRAATQTVTVDYATVDGNALAGLDYVAANGTLSFAPGVRERTLQVLALGNTEAQADRVFRVVLSNPLNARVLAGPVRDGKGLIIDDDDPLTAVIVTDPPLPDAVVGVPYASAPFTALHLVTTTPPLPRWTLPSGFDSPQGLSISLNGGVLSGVPQRAGRYWFHVQVTGDFPQVAEREYSLLVRPDAVFSDGFEETP